MTRADAEAYAQEWIANWNRRDIDAIVSHHAEDATFVSPVAAERTGNALVRGRTALAAYWSFARQLDRLVFELEATTWDDEQQELLIVYRRDINDRRDRACEIVRFDNNGLVAHGEAMYGAEQD